MFLNLRDLGYEGSYDRVAASGKQCKASHKKNSLAYAISVGIIVPDYEIERRLWVNDHYEGTYLFQRTVIFEIVMDSISQPGWGLTYYWTQAGTKAQPNALVLRKIDEEKFEVLLALQAASAWPPRKSSSMKAHPYFWSEGGRKS